METEKFELMCTVTLPQVCDVGRTVELDVHIFPADSDVALRVVTDSSDIVDVDGWSLVAHRPNLYYDKQNQERLS